MNDFTYSIRTRAPAGVQSEGIPGRGLVHLPAHGLQINLPQH